MTQKPFLIADAPNGPLAGRCVSSRDPPRGPGDHRMPRVQGIQGLGILAGDSASECPRPASSS